EEGGGGGVAPRGAAGGAGGGVGGLVDLGHVGAVGDSGRADVAPTVVGDLVPGGGDLAGDRRVLADQRADHEEGGRHARALQDVEHLGGEHRRGPVVEGEGGDSAGRVHRPQNVLLPAR